MDDEPAESVITASEVLAAAKVLEWIAEHPCGQNTKGHLLLRLRLQIMQADLGQLSYALLRNEDPSRVVLAMAQRECSEENLAPQRT